MEQTQTMTSATEQSHQGDVFEKLRELMAGHWYHRLLVDTVQSYNEKAAPEVVASTDPLPAAARIIKKASMQAALLGTGAAAITTGGAVLTGETHGIAGLVAIPAAGMAMVADLVARARVTARMSCEIADLFGIRFEPQNPADLAELHAVATKSVQQPETGDSRGHELLESLVSQHQEQLASAVGAAAVTETLVRNVIPVVGLVNSGLASYRLTEQLGQTLITYSRARRALEDAIAPIERDAPQLMDLLVEGIWFMFTSDGTLTPHEAAILARLIRKRPSNVKHALLLRLHDDEAGWIQRLAEVPAEQRSAFMHALTVASASDEFLADSERALRERVARALAVRIDDGGRTEMPFNAGAQGTSSAPH